MNVAIAQARPPYIEFKRIAKDDPKRSVELGYRVTKDVDMAYVMQPGSKDQVERVATDWLESIKRKMLEGAPDAYPEEWVMAIHKKYDAWKQGQEAPLDGTSVREWPVLSPAQAENFIAMHILTIEDVAAMTEEAMSRFMGARDLREKAREWLKGKEISESAMKENVELKQANAAMQKTMAELLERISMLENREVVPAEAPKKRGRPKKTEE